VSIIEIFWMKSWLHFLFTDIGSLKLVRRIIYVMYMYIDSF